MIANTCMASRAARYGSMDIDIHNFIILFSGAFKPPRRRSQADQTMCIDELWGWAMGSILNAAYGLSQQGRSADAWGSESHSGLTKSKIWTR